MDRNTTRQSGRKSPGERWKTMKQYVVIVLMLLACPILAEAKMDLFTTKVNISTTNGTAYLYTENGQNTISPNSRSQFTITLYRNTSCKEDLLIAYLMREDARNNESLKYQKLFGNCSTELGITKGKAYFNANITYQDKFNTCTQQLTQNNCAGTQNELSTCNTNLNKEKSDKNTMMLVAAGAGLAIGYMLWGKKNPQVPMSKMPQMH